MKSLIVLVIDHDAYESETGMELRADEILQQGRFVNEDSAAILGYEAWMVVHDAPASLVRELGMRNVPDLTLKPVVAPCS